MIVASPTDIRKALAKTVPGVRVALGQTDYATDNGLDALTFTMTVLVGQPGDPHAEEHLDYLAGPTGLKATVERDPTLGNLVAHLAVTRCSGWQIHRTPDGDRLGATWTVTTYA